ncbi:hypothetical protein KZZ52_53695 [Dactylosporangium sp. AC04546]|uniref:helix-turn-helix transcriptional regulator n=1 Tax=Dactylosporangium sp. AC04546 TaxID=2862460 RepID=UPI002E7AF91D|nr:hypothetical protein [Dactylosporangium sp. AC04546]WVK82709.1 hypothetical protein KZZ52_53695 [Dactylosporangium sp. AC04546]
MSTHQSPLGAADSDVWTFERIRALGVTTTLTTAASVLGISRSQAYQLAAANTFPVPLIRAGTRIIVPVAGLLRVLLADDPVPVPAGQRLDPGTKASVDATTTPPADYATRRWRARTDHPGDDE